MQKPDHLSQADWDAVHDTPEITPEEWASRRPEEEIMPPEMRAFIQSKRRAGRPKSSTPKELVSIRLDRDLLERLRASGSGWQGRANDILRRAGGLEPTRPG